MFNFPDSVKIVLAIAAVGAMMCSTSQATEKKKATRKIATDFSGARVGSSNVYEVGSVNEEGMKTDIARLENIEIVKRIEGGRIALVKVDSGGSTDIGSVMASSSLYLIFFQDGEMHNKKAAFALGGVNTFTIKDIKNSVLTVEMNCKDSSLKPIKVNSIINFSKFEKDFLNYQEPGTMEEDFNDWLPQGKITMSHKCLPDFE